MAVSYFVAESIQYGPERATSGLFFLGRSALPPLGWILLWFGC